MDHCGSCANGTVSFCSISGYDYLKLDFRYTHKVHITNVSSVRSAPFSGDGHKEFIVYEYTGKLKMDLPTMTNPYLQRVIPTHIWWRSVMNPRFSLSQPRSAFFFLPLVVVISLSGLDRTVDICTIPYSLPAWIRVSNIYNGSLF